VKDNIIISGLTNILRQPAKWITKKQTVDCCIYFDTVNRLHSAGVPFTASAESQKGSERKDKLLYSAH